MPQPILTWALELKPSEKKTFEITSMADLKITNATLDPVLNDDTGRSTVVLNIINSASNDSDSEIESDDASENDSEPSPPIKLVLTSLTPGKIESTLHDTIITRPATVVCEVIGKNTIHLSGYFYIPDSEMNSSDSDEDYPGANFGLDDDDESDEEYLDEMEHDLEPDDSELGDMGQEMHHLLQDSGRFEVLDDEEEEDETPAKEAKKPVEATKKRPREAEEDEVAPKLSKKERKLLKAQQQAAAASTEKKPEAPPQKKQKTADGKAVAVAPAKKEAQSSKEVKTNGDAAPAAKKGEQKAKGEKKEKEKAKTGTDSKEPGAGKTVQHPNGLSITDTTIGTGATAKKGSRLAMRYIGKLSNGSTFDSNTNGRPFQFRLGKGEVIRGWDEGLIGMKVGGERRLVIPPALGYGKQKSGSIPPNSTLTFEVKLLDIS